MGGYRSRLGNDAVERILVSACLLGQAVRYDGRDNLLAGSVLARWQAEGRLVALCPEVAGGLPVPRPPAEILAWQPLQIRDIDGRDVTAAFQAGAEAAVQRVRALGIRLALLKENSPSCGPTQVYDGRFSGTRVAGEGLTAARLRALGVAVFSERQLAELEARLAVLEA